MTSVWRIATAFSLLATPAAAITLQEYARAHPIRVYTIGKDKIPLARSDNTNNLADEGGKVIHLSRTGLTSLQGISKLRVMDGGVERPIADLENLHLYLNENSIPEIPAELFTLTNLHWLYLYYNQLKEIPPGIAKLPNLLGMYFTGNDLHSIPAEIYGMRQLRKFQVSKNHIRSIPPELGNLTELRHLNLADNEIETLPDTLSRLQRLRVCDFSGNRIRQLPDSFGQVPIVHQLRVIGNPLTSLPAGFADMPGSIDITDTNIDLASLSPGLRARISREKVSDKVKPGKKPKP